MRNCKNPGVVNKIKENEMISDLIKSNFQVFDDLVNFDRSDFPRHV